METLKQKQKEEALLRLRMLGVMGQVRNDFRKKEPVIYYSERQNAFFNATLYWVSNHPTWEKAIKDFENRNGVMVYHCQLIHMEFGDILSLMYVAKDEEEWENERKDIRDGLTFVKCLDVTNENDIRSIDYGYIGIKPSMGGIARIS